MEQFKAVAILGRQPGLGVAEFESLYGADSILPIEHGLLSKLPCEQIDFKRLGGTIKLAKVLTYLPTTKWADIEAYLAENIPRHLTHLPDGKFTLGLSAYGGLAGAQTVNISLLKLKKLIRKSGRPVRIVPNKSADLNSAQVLHNRLTSRGAWELLAIRHKNQTVLAQTLFVQDIDAYTARDQLRPHRDAKVGMLPPKLAQIIINLAAGSLKPPAILLDPFCGTGVIMQEALLMGYGVTGTDIDPRMVQYSEQNISWLAQKSQLGPNLPAKFETGDARSHRWPEPINLIASEIFLGAPLHRQLPGEQLRTIAAEVNDLLTGFLANIHGQLNKGTRLCLAVPAWRSGNNFERLPALNIDKLTDIGYNRLSFVHVENSGLIYHRPQQFVARELVLLQRK